jgi:Coenzyme PQQ synthesis protein D (PqqD)
MANDSSLPARVGISDHVLFQEIEGECVLLDMASEQYFGLDDVGTRMWQLLVEHGDPAKVIEQLRKVYNVEESQLRTDLANLIAGLKASGLVRVEDSI